MTVMHMHGTKFNYSGVAWNVFPEVQQTIGVKRRLDRMEGRDFIAVELGAHLIDFFSPDAMFPTDAAANFNAQSSRIFPPSSSARANSPGSLASKKD